MRILILEDQEVRTLKFAFQLTGHDVTFTADTKQCIKLLENEDWDVLFLDHDLEGPWICKSGPGTGYEVAKWLEANPMRQPRLIFTHTFNSAGAEKICRAVPKTRYFKCAWEVHCLNEILQKMMEG